MSDGTLLVFGCVVSFTALAGAYIYLHQAFLAQARVDAPVVEPVRKVHDVA